MPTQNVPNMTPVPAFPALSERAAGTYNSSALAFGTHMHAVFNAELLAVANNVKYNADDSKASADAAALSVLAAAAKETAAAASAVAAATSANTAAASAGGQLWVSGTTYAVGAMVFSAVTGRNYRRIVAGAGATDPSADSTNWRAVLLDAATGLPPLRPSLLLDFANSKNVDSRITFTRASTATRTNEKGLIETVAANVPRLDFDPVTGECRGLLIEETRTNLLPYSEQFDNADWNKTNCTISSNAEVAPDGSITADAAVNTGNVVSLVSRTLAVTASSTNDHYASIFVKPISPNVTFTLNVYHVGNLEVNVHFNFSTKTVLGNAPYPGEVLFDSLPNGWFRVGFRVARDATGAITSLNYRFWQSGRGNTTGGCYVWGAQLELGASPTSYTPTGAAQVTRAADAATMTGANFSSWYRQDEGAFVCEFDAPAIPQDSTTFNKILSVNDGSTVNRMELFIGGGWTNDRIGLFVASHNAAHFDSTNNTAGWIPTPVSSPATNATAYKKDDFSTVWNGGQVVVGSTGSVPSVNRLDIANYLSGGQLNGHIRRIVYYPKHLSNLELQALTTP